MRSDRPLAPQCPAPCRPPSCGSMCVTNKPCGRLRCGLCLYIISNLETPCTWRHLWALSPFSRHSNRLCCTCGNKGTFAQSFGIYISKVSIQHGFSSSSCTWAPPPPPHPHPPPLPKTFLLFLNRLSRSVRKCHTLSENVTVLRNLLKDCSFRNQQYGWQNFWQSEESSLLNAKCCWDNKPRMTKQG